MNTRFTLFTILIMTPFLLLAQGVGIGTTTPEESAILDVTSTEKGLLIPRMTAADREAIDTPAKGLMVFDNETNSFWFYNGTEWNEIGADDGDVFLVNSNVISGDGAGANLLGDGANASANIAIGNNALSTAQSGGNGFNVAVGWNSQPLTGDVVFGNPFGFFFAFGNASVGGRTLEQNTTGAQNAALGYQSLQSNTTGSANAAVGSFALNRTTTGNGNIAMGLRAGQGNITGEGNLYIGFDAGRGTNQATDGSAENTNVTFLGRQTGVSDAGINYTNSTALGFEALITADNQIVLGNGDISEITTSGNLVTSGNINATDVTATGNLSGIDLNSSGDVNTGNLNATGDANVTNVLATGNVSSVDVSASGDISTTNLTATANVDAVDVNASGNVNATDVNATGEMNATAFNTTSDGRFKYNVEENVKGLEFILNLRPVVYNFDYTKHAKFNHKGEKSNTGKIETGFIAQEVEIAAENANYNFDGVKIPENLEDEHYSVDYSKFVMPLTKAIQELKGIIDGQNKQIKALSAELAEVKAGQTGKLQSIKSNTNVAQRQ
ncbi:MAG: tail fiber domain-containing protein [Bacteroidota bacterium]